MSRFNILIQAKDGTESWLRSVSIFVNSISQTEDPAEALRFSNMEEAEETAGLVETMSKNSVTCKVIRK